MDAGAGAVERPARAVGTRVPEHDPFAVWRKRRLGVVARCGDHVAGAGTVGMDDADAAVIGIGPRRVNDPLAVGGPLGCELERVGLRDALRLAAREILHVDVAERAVGDALSVG